jgi:hypothetical protein
MTTALLSLFHIVELSSIPGPRGNVEHLTFNIFTVIIIRHSAVHSKVVHCSLKSGAE